MRDATIWIENKRVCNRQLAALDPRQFSQRIDSAVIWNVFTKVRQSSCRVYDLVTTTVCVAVGHRKTIDSDVPRQPNANKTRSSLWLTKQRERKLNVRLIE